MSRRLSPLELTPVYASLWEFAAERQRVYFRRLRGQHPPWTDNTVLRQFRFTNCYRASDRVSQFLIRRVVYNQGVSMAADEVFFRVMLFKLFNRIDTWRSLEDSIGWPTLANFSVERYSKALNERRMKGNPIYSAAYIMPPPHRDVSKHRAHLSLLRQMLLDELPERLSRCGSMQEAYLLLRSYRGIGDFLAYQFVIDLNYSPLLSFSESDFVVAGPGAEEGISKCFSGTAGLNPAELIRLVTDRQGDEFGFYAEDFITLWGRPLHLVDVQNLFCEIGKYARVRHPRITGKSKRLRVKQKFRSNGQVPSPWFPPKWGLNDKITKWREQAEHSGGQGVPGDQKPGGATREAP